MRWSALVIGLPVLALLLVVAADLIPDRFVVEPLYQATVDGTLDADNYGRGYSGGQLDEFSECKRMTVGMGALDGQGAFESAVRSPTLGPCDVAVRKIVGWAQGDGLTRSYDYFRYWNGSTVVLRPSIALVGLAGTRLLAAAGLALVAVSFAVALARAVGRTAMVLFLAPLLLTTDYIDLPGALVHALGMIVALGCAALMLRFLSSHASVGRFGAAAFASGAGFLFLADLTNPDAAWALATSSAAIVAVDTQRLGAAVRRVGAAGVGWIAGFAWMWVCKWLVASLVVGYETVRFVISNQAEERLGLDGSDGSPLEGLRRAWAEWWNEPLFGIVVLGLVAVAGVTVWRRGDLGATWRGRLLLCTPAAIPVVWHLVLRNHTAVHSWFTYRSLAVAFGIVLMGLTARLGSDARRHPARSPGTSSGDRHSESQVSDAQVSESQVSGDRVSDDQVRYGSATSGSMS